MLYSHKLWRLRRLGHGMTIIIGLCACRLYSETIRGLRYNTTHHNNTKSTQSNGTIQVFQIAFINFNSQWSSKRKHP